MSASPNDRMTPKEKRKGQSIFLLPSLKAAIDKDRETMRQTRSEWIEGAIIARLIVREKMP